MGYQKSSEESHQEYLDNPMRGDPWRGPLYNLALAVERYQDNNPRKDE